MEVTTIALRLDVFVFKSLQHTLWLWWALKCHHCVTVLGLKPLWSWAYKRLEHVLIWKRGMSPSTWLISYGKHAQIFFPSFLSIFFVVGGSILACVQVRRRWTSLCFFLLVRRCILGGGCSRYSNTRWESKRFKEIVKQASTCFPFPFLYRFLVDIRLSYFNLFILVLLSMYVFLLVSFMIIYLI